MYLNFKRGSLLFVLGLLGMCPGLAQEIGEAGKERSGTQVDLRLGAALPTAMGDNFLNRAYTLKTGFTGELTVYLNERYFVGYQGTFNASEVAETALVGLYERSVLRHHYAIGGYSMFPRTDALGITAGIGAGYASYRNKKGNTLFYDKGFSLMAHTKLGYRFSKQMGWYAGVQVSSDFLDIATAPEIEGAFKQAHILFVTTGVVLSFGS